MGSEKQVLRLADILVNHSVKAKKGEIVRISCGDLAKPLALAVYREVLRAGAHPLLAAGFDDAQRIFFEEASDAQIAHLPPTKLYEAKKIDADIVIIAPGNTRALSHIPPKKLADKRKAVRPISEIVLRRVRWVLTNFPTESLAQETDRSLPEYEKLYYRAVDQDWAAMANMFRRAKMILEKSSQVRIVGKDTDLSFSIKGRKAIPCAGEYNMPDGEIFTAPVENSTEGTIRYEFPAIYGGREVSGIRLTFRKGKVVDASAEKNEPILKEMLAADPGAGILGEFGIGANAGVSDFTRDILLDEKMGGTIHLAIGRSYPESGGKNISAVHWDMIKDLRSEGELYFDGRPVLRTGHLFGKVLPGIKAR
ncbi:MAG: aminopeptidase [Deltaproteobacteria bacterium]|nr:aminopeptidase [Deltaproteobacteria bacterium]